jgi:excisionase family DNA binding protein
MEKRGEWRLWNVREVAEFLGLSPGTVYHMVSEGRIPVVRISARCIKFRPSEIENWLDEMTMPARAASLAGNSRSRKNGA